MTWRVVLETRDMHGFSCPTIYRAVPAVNSLEAIDAALVILGDNLKEHWTLGDAWATPEDTLTTVQLKKKQLPQWERFNG